MKNPVFARKKIYRVSFDAMLLAINVVMNVAVPSELSWASLPVLVCAFVMRPADTVAVAVIGSFIEQLFYGLNVTTGAWMLPWLIFSLYVGFGAAWARRRESTLLTVFVIASGEILLNICNTSVLLALGFIVFDPTTFVPWLPLPLAAVAFYLARMPQAVVRAVLSSVALPLLMPPLRRVLAKLNN